MASLARRLVCAALTIVVVTSLAANCFAGVVPSREQMVCCNEVQHDCGPAMRAMDCCVSTRSSDATFVAAKPVAPSKPILAVTCTVAVGQFAPRATLHVSGRFVGASASSPPLFLLASSLRI